MVSFWFENVIIFYDVVGVVLMYYSDFNVIVFGLYFFGFDFDDILFLFE